MSSSILPSLAAVAFLCANGFTASLPIDIKNPSFEDNAATLIPSPGNFTTNNVPQWTATSAGLFRPDTPVNFAPDGVAVSYVNTGGTVTQALTYPGGATVTAAPGARISVTMKARPRSITGSCVMTLDARVGATSVSQTQGIINLATNATNYSTVSADVTMKDAAGLGALNGQQVTLAISNSSTGDQANIDQVSATISYPPVISSLIAAPQPASSGQPVTISWTVTGANSVSFNGGDVTGQSSAILTAPAAPQSYTLSATNDDGTTTRSVLVDVLPAALNLNATVFISEALAENTTGITDEDGQRNDWIELANATAAPVNIAGWTITDDRATPNKWTFPAASIVGSGRLLIWASAKNRAVAGQPLHTNFKLDNDGDSLWLFNSLGVLQSYLTIPAAPPNVSYGIGTGPKVGQFLSVSPANSSVKWLVPSAAVSDDWRGGNEPFADAAWNNGQWTLGYDVASFTAYSIPVNTAGVQNFNGALGLDFDVVRTIEVNQLGCFDHQSNGIASGTTISVQLWRRSGTPTVLDIDPVTAGTQSVVTFTSASGGTLVSGQRFKSLTGPVSLTPGQYTVVAYGYGAAEMNGNMNGAIPFPVTTNGGGGAVNFVGTGRWGNTQGVFPPNADAGPAARYGAGSFIFKEPSGAVFTTNTAAAMQNINATALTRTAFSLTSVPDCPVLKVTSDDGFVAWINGVEVGRRNAPAVPAYNSAATTAGTGTTSISLSGILGLLRVGTNILAIQGMNVTTADPDFRLTAEITAQDTQGGQRVLFSTPTPNAPNGSGALATHVIFNELHVDPVDSKIQLVEFVELFNPTGSAVNLGGWSMTGGITYTFPANTIIQPCGYLVIGENPSHLATYLNFPGALGPWTGGLGNNGDEVVLRDPTLTAVDRVAYEQGFPWPTVGDFPSVSMQRIHHGLDANLGASWRSGTPTPGTDNNVLTNTPAPAIRQVDHLPAAPTSGQAVTVTAKISDPDGISGAWLEYQIVEPGSYIRTTDAAWTTNWIPVAMNDAGTAGDAVAGDDVFTAVIPGAVQVHRRLIRYRIRAWDGVMNHVRVPYADDDSPNFAYFCYDGVPAWSAAVQPGVTTVDTFSTATMRKVRPWHLLSNATDVQNCQYVSSFNDGTYRFEGTLVIDGKVYDHVHYRIKGQNSTFNTGKNKWKVQFNRGHLLKMPDDYGLTSTTIRTLNISSVPAPWAPWNRGMSGLDEAVAFKLSALAGVPSPRTSYLQWRVIDGAAEQNPANQYDSDLWGLYLAFENTDNFWKEEHGVEDGNIFRMQKLGAGNSVLGQGKGMPANLSDLSDFTSTTTGYWLGGGTETVAPLVTAIQPESWFRAHVDLPEYFSWRAVTEAINQTDRRDQENVVYFRRPSDSRWQILPWDVDLLYENFDRWGPQAVQNGVNLKQYEQIARGLIHPAILTEFQNRSRELQDLLLNSDQAWKVIDEFISIITDESPRLIPNGGAINDGFVEAERRRWDYNPTNPTPPRGAGPTGNYYKTPYPIGNMTNGPFPQPYNRVLPSGDFEGMVKWIKDFIVGSNNGGARLAKMANGEIEPYGLTATAAVQIPNTPAISYSGTANFPQNQLQFTTSAFSSPNGQSFAAIQWRIGEIYDPSVPGFTAGQPWRYEIEPLWTSPELPVFSATANVPATGLVTGRTYRARVRHKDAAGRWSHWSAPVQFQATAAIPGDLAANLVISEIMYNPPAPEGSDAEFIELMNIHPTASLDLTGVQFAAGITFNFTPGTMLAPGARILVVRNTIVFTAKYGVGKPVAGEYQNNAQNSLDNGGERLVLSLGSTPLRDFSYDNNAPWPTEPDNGGASLVLIAPRSNPDHANPYNWRPGLTPSPGTDDALHFTGNPLADAESDGLIALLEYAMGTSDSAADSSPAVTWQNGAPVLTFTQQLAADDAELILETSTDLATWQQVAGTEISRTRTGTLAQRTIEIPVPPATTRFYTRLRARLR